MQRLKRATVMVVVGVFLAACGGGAQGTASGSGSSPHTINITVTHPTNDYIIPWLAARDQGYFKQRGVKIGKIVPGKGGSTTLRNIIQGGLALGEVAYPAIVEGYAGGADIRVVGGATQTANSVNFYALANNRSVDSLRDVERWGYTNPGSVTQAVSYLIPEEAGVDPSSFKRVATGGVGEGIALLEAGKVDVSVIPPSIYLRSPNKFRRIARTTEYLPKFQQTAIVASPEYAQENPKVIKAVLKGYQRGVQWIEDNPDKAAKLYANHADISRDIARQIVEQDLKVDNWGIAFNADAIKTGSRALKATGFKQPVPYCDLFTTEYLPMGSKGNLPADCGSQ